MPLPGLRFTRPTVLPARTPLPVALILPTQTLMSPPHVRVPLVVDTAALPRPTSAAMLLVSPVPPTAPSVLGPRVNVTAVMIAIRERTTTPPTPAGTSSQPKPLLLLLPPLLELTLVTVLLSVRDYVRCDVLLVLVRCLVFTIPAIVVTALFPPLRPTSSIFRAPSLMTW